MSQSKTLFSAHYLEHRLPQHPEWDEALAPELAAARALWERAQQFGDHWDEAQTEAEFIQPFLALLGWESMVQPKAHHAGRPRRPDYALFADAATRDAAYPHQGDDAAFYAQTLVIAEAKYWQRPLSQRDPGEREAWDSSANPSYQIVSYLVGTGVAWGFLTNGRVWRLYSREVSSTASEFYEVDLADIFAGEDNDGVKRQTSNVTPAPSPISETPFQIPNPQFKRFWLFFRRAAFIPDARGRCFVQRVHAGSATYAREISDKLKELVYAEVMPEIAGGFIAYRREQLGIQAETEASLSPIYQASLSLLYKLLFLLYAEARALLPVDKSGYRDQSLTRLAQWAAERLDARASLSTATFATPKYNALLALFRRIAQGDPSLGIPRYDGGLFNPHTPDNRFLEQHRLSDRAVARAIDLLVRDAGEPVDYAYISVRNLGAIYEGLLENKLRIENWELGMKNETPTLHPPFTIPNSSFQIHLVNDKGERKATGSYYTPDYIVAYIVEHTLGPIVAARASDFAAAMARVGDARRALAQTADLGRTRLLRVQLEAAERDAREAFLGIKVCDPAMGSGHFLVNAVDYLTDQVIRRMQAYHDAPGNEEVRWEWNPIQQLIERVRADVLADMAAQGIAVDAARLDDTALLTRLVMKRCIYGVDLNPMAVELAKLSLWLHSFTVGAPLSFLDHHLRCGNSLIGTDVRAVEAAMREDESGQFGLFQGPFAGLLDLTALMIEVVDRADATLSDVLRSAEEFAALQRMLTPYKQALDLWVSRHFGNPRAAEFLRLFGEDVLPALRGEREIAPEHQAALARAREVWEEKRFFHWDLEFPEIFVDLERRDWRENPGFDAILGNPPYIRSIRLKNADQETWAYYGAAYQTATKGEFDIYLCFAEQGMKLMNPHGYLGVIIPNKWLTTRVGETLRTIIARHKAVRHIVDFGAFQVFEGVTTYTCLLFLNSIPRQEIQIATLARAARTEKPLPGDAGDWHRGAVSLDKLTAEAWIFALGLAGEVLTKLQQWPSLETIADVFAGTGTRADAVFFMERQGERFYSRLLEQWVDVEPAIMYPSLTGQDIDPYSYETRNYLLFPYRQLDTEVELIPPETLASQYPLAWAYLNHPTNRQILESRDKGYFQTQDAWYAYGRPQNMTLIGQEKIVGPDVVSRAEFVYDAEGRYIIDTVYAIHLHAGEPFSLLALTALLNSRVMTFFLQQTGTDLRGGYFRMKTAYLNPFPIPDIRFTTPAAERAALLEQAIALYETLTLDNLLAFVDARLQNSDVVHDLLAYLAEQMMALHKQRQRVERALDPFKYLNRGARFVKLTAAFAEAIKYGAQLPPPSPGLDLDAAHHDIDGLRLVPDDDHWRLDVQCKLRDPADEWRSWQYAGDGRTIARVWVSVYRFPPDALDAARGRYYQHALPVLAEFAEAKAFPGGRTRTTRAKLRATSVPAFDSAADLAPLVELGAELSAVQSRIAATDALIDQIVYRLYGLTADEIAVVAGRGN